jgi:hypothetical protein
MIDEAEVPYAGTTYAAAVYANGAATYGNYGDAIYSDNAQELKVELREISTTSGTYNAVAGGTTAQYGQGKRYKNTTKIAERDVFTAATEHYGLGARYPLVAYGGSAAMYGNYGFPNGDAHTFKYILTPTEKGIIEDFTKLEVWFYADLDIVQMTIGGLLPPAPTGEVSMYVRASTNLP